MKKSLLIIAIAFTGGTVYAQQAPTDGATKSKEKPALVGKKLDIKSGAVSQSKTNEPTSTLWVPIGEANRSGKKNLKLNVK